MSRPNPTKSCLQLHSHKLLINMHKKWSTCYAIWTIQQLISSSLFAPFRWKFWMIWNLGLWQYYCKHCQGIHSITWVISLITNLATRWQHLHWYKFGYHVEPLALVANLATRWRHFCIGFTFYHQVAPLALACFRRWNVWTMGVWEEMMKEEKLGALSPHERPPRSLSGGRPTNHSRSIGNRIYLL